MKRIEILMNKLNDFHKILGGEETGLDIKKKELDEYQTGLIEARNSIKTVDDTIKDRFEKIELFGYQSRERITIDAQVKRVVEEASFSLSQLEGQIRKLVKKKQGYTKEEIEQKEKVILLMREQLDMLKEDSKRGGLNASQSLNPVHDEGVPNLEYTGGMGPERELLAEENVALERFHENDQEIDKILILIIDDLDTLKEQAKDIDSVIDRNQELIQKVQRKADLTTERMISTNKRLKDIINKVLLYL